jgi:hypothetical protein
VALVRIDVSEERFASIIRLTIIGELGIPVRCEEILQLLVTANIIPSSLILGHLDGGSDMFLRIVGSYKSHTA